MSRPPGYDRETVIARATAVFWERGYGRTSVGDLVRATGLKPGSLYAAFGSKKGVFLEVLDGYNRAFLERLDALEATGLAPIDVISALLDEIAEETVAGRDRRGCLSVNTLLEMAQHDPEIAGRVLSHLDRLKAALIRLLEKARASGELVPEGEPVALADFVVNNIWGMRVMCKGRPSAESMQGIVDSVKLALRAR